MYQVCVFCYTLFQTFLSHTHKYSDTLTQPSVHTSVIILIDSACATRPLFYLGDAITVLNAYTKGRAHVCEGLCAYVCRRPFTEPAVHTTRQVMTVHVCEQVKSSVC